MTYVLWMAVGCGLVGIIRTEIEVRANYMRRQKSEDHMEKLYSSVK
jgi:hypothetical protein